MLVTYLDVLLPADAQPLGLGPPTVWGDGLWGTAPVMPLKGWVAVTEGRILRRRTAQRLLRRTNFVRAQIADRARRAPAGARDIDVRRSAIGWNLSAVRVSLHYEPSRPHTVAGSARDQTNSLNTALWNRR